MDGSEVSSGLAGRTTTLLISHPVSRSNLVGPHSQVHVAFRGLCALAQGQAVGAGWL